MTINRPCPACGTNLEVTASVFDTERVCRVCWKWLEYERERAQEAVYRKPLVAYLAIGPLPVEIM